MTLPALDICTLGRHRAESGAWNADPLYGDGASRACCGGGLL